MIWRFAGYMFTFKFEVKEGCVIGCIMEIGQLQVICIMSE